MKRIRVVPVVLVLSALIPGALFLSPEGRAQSSGQVRSSALVVQVRPEAYLNPSSIQLSFPVSGPGQPVYSQSSTVKAWVRALPNQRIEVSAQAVSLTGPTGSEPISSLSFSGTMTDATGGAKSSHCASGSFSDGPDQPLIADWNQSGIATCAVSFALTPGASWPVGTYTVRANLKLLVH